MAWSLVLQPDGLRLISPLQCSSGLLGTTTGISSKVCPSAPVGRASWCLWCGTWWPRTGCMFSVRAGITSAMTGTGRLTGAQEIIRATWQMWLSLMEVRSWKACPWACRGSESVRADVMVWLKLENFDLFGALVVWFIFTYLLFWLDGNAPSGGLCSPENHNPSSSSLPLPSPTPSMVFTNLLVWPLKTLNILTSGTEDDNGNLVALGVSVLPFCSDTDLHWSLHHSTWVALLFGTIFVNYIVSNMFNSSHICLVWGLVGVFCLMRGRKLEQEGVTSIDSVLTAGNV